MMGIPSSVAVCITKSRFEYSSLPVEYLANSGR